MTQSKDDLLLDFLLLFEGFLNFLIISSDASAAGNNII